MADQDEQRNSVSKRVSLLTFVPLNYNCPEHSWKTSKQIFQRLTLRSKYGVFDKTKCFNKT